jgi:hypothetical protein
MDRTKTSDITGESTEIIKPFGRFALITQSTNS